MIQKEAFLKSEGDAWFARNREALQSPEHLAADPVLQFLARQQKRPERVLEVGCADGWRLAELLRRYGSCCYGVDPSAEAVKKACAGVQIRQSTADNLPFDDESFDLVIFGFCLYLCDPNDYFKIAAEADRVLKPGGKISIYDFDTPVPYANDYAHLDGVVSHKMEFAKMFTWHPAYALCEKSIVGDADCPLDERVAHSVVVKRPDGAFPKRG